MIAIAFCMGTNIIGTDGAGLAASAFGQPMAMIAFNSFGKNGSVAYLFFLWFSSVCNCSMLMVAASRETFAFARDHGLPGSSWIRVLARNKSPVRAVAFVACFTIIEGLLMLVNTVAINSIFNLAIMGLYFAYCMPLISRIIWKRFTPGVWYLGDTLSYAFAVYSVAWMIFIFILLIFPDFPNPTPAEFNYAVVVLGFVLAFCTVYWYLPVIGGRYFFTGPVRTIDELIGSDPDLDQELVKKTADDKEGEDVSS